MLLRFLFLHTPQLSDLHESFLDFIKMKEDLGQKIEIISFVETKPTYLFNCFSIGCVSMATWYA